MDSPNLLQQQTNVLSADGTPDLSWIVGGCMDQAVHIWHITRQPAGAAAAAEEASNSGAATNSAKGGGDDGDDEAQPPVPTTTVDCPDGSKLTLVELTCGGYAGKVTRVDFGAAAGDGGPLLASCGGHACMIWSFGGDGPAGTAPMMLLGHSKAVDCQAWHPSKPGVIVTGGRDGRLLVYETENAADMGDEGMPSLCAPAALDPAPADEVVAVAWTPGGTLLSAHANGGVQSWTVEL
jgi:WD40 repeat protein